MQWRHRPSARSLRASCVRCHVAGPRSTTRALRPVEAQLHSHKPTKRRQQNATQKTPSKTSRYKMQHNQVILKHFRHHISYHNTSLHRSLLGLVTLEYFWICRKILGAKVFLCLLLCHVPVMLSCPEIM